MKIFSYQENTIALLNFIKHHTPKRIFSDEFYRVVFDYQDFYIAAVLNIFVAASQNQSDEVITVEFQEIRSSFEPSKEDKLMFQEQGVNRLWILQTMLYFTNHVVYEGENEGLRDIEVATETNQVIADMISKSTGGHQEIVCHPDSTEAKSVNPEFANLVEAGIMLEVDHQLLMCFSFGNGFNIVGRIMSINEIQKEVAPDYKFLEI